MFPCLTPATLFPLFPKTIFTVTAFEEFTSLAWLSTRSRTAKYQISTEAQCTETLKQWFDMVFQLSDLSIIQGRCWTHPPVYASAKPLLVSTYLQMMSTNRILDICSLPLIELLCLLHLMSFPPTAPVNIQQVERRNYPRCELLCVYRWKSRMCLMWAVCTTPYDCCAVVVVIVFCAMHYSCCLVSQKYSNLFWQETHPVTSAGFSFCIGAVPFVLETDFLVDVY